LPDVGVAVDDHGAGPFGAGHEAADRDVIGSEGGKAIVKTGCR
jgi:hypothetical protein